LRNFNLSLAAALVLVLSIGTAVLAAPPPDLHCPSGGVKDETGAATNDLVLALGTSFCVKAGTENTGVLVANGWSTLQDYLVLAGIMDGSGQQGRDVSYFVVYSPEVTPTPGPTTPPTVEPTPQPSLPDSAMSSASSMANPGPLFLGLAGLLLFGIGLYMAADAMSNRRRG
jgi:hypothetical protein